VALLTYSTKPRGGVVHSLYLAEALHRLGHPVHVFGLGDPLEGFFRRVAVPYTVLRATRPAETLEERVFENIEALTSGLRAMIPGAYDIIHAQDCIAARAAVGLREEGAGVAVLRTVHHVDDFTTPALAECQRRSIVDPDHVLVVSRYWQKLLAEDYGRDADIVINGVDASRFCRPAAFDGTRLRAAIGANDKFLFLSVGGIEPRKGSLHLVEALASVNSTLSFGVSLALVGGHSFQDYDPYRAQVLARASALELALDRDIVLLGTVSDSELPSWFHTADAFVFPSLKEGWGIAVLEAMAAGLPVVVSDIPVFREYLNDADAVFVAAGSSHALAGGMLRVATDPFLRSRLAASGPGVASRFTWAACARTHIEIYGRVVRSST